MDYRPYRRTNFALCLTYHSIECLHVTGYLVLKIWISGIVVRVQHLFIIARMQKVTVRNPYWAGQQLKTFQVPILKQGKIKSAKGKGWAPTFICCAQDTVGL